MDPPPSSGAGPKPNLARDFLGVAGSPRTGVAPPAPPRPRATPQRPPPPLPTAAGRTTATPLGPLGSPAPPTLPETHRRSSLFSSGLRDTPLAPTGIQPLLDLSSLGDRAGVQAATLRSMSELDTLRHVTEKFPVLGGTDDVNMIAFAERYLQAKQDESAEFHALYGVDPPADLVPRLVQLVPPRLRPGLDVAVRRWWQTQFDDDERPPYAFEQALGQRLEALCRVGRQDVHPDSFRALVGRDWFDRDTNAPGAQPEVHAVILWRLLERHARALGFGPALDGSSPFADAHSQKKLLRVCTRLLVDELGMAYPPIADYLARAVAEYALVGTTPDALLEFLQQRAEALGGLLSRHPQFAARRPIFATLGDLMRPLRAPPAAAYQPPRAQPLRALPPSPPRGMLRQPGGPQQSAAPRAPLPGPPAAPKTTFQGTGPRGPRAPPPPQRSSAGAPASNKQAARTSNACFVCGQGDHYARECPQRTRQATAFALFTLARNAGADADVLAQFEETLEDEYGTEAPGEHVAEDEPVIEADAEPVVESEVTPEDVYSLCVDGVPGGLPPGEPDLWLTLESADVGAEPLFATKATADSGSSLSCVSRSVAEDMLRAAGGAAKLVDLPAPVQFLSAGGDETQVFEQALVSPFWLRVKDTRGQAHLLAGRAVFFVLPMTRPLVLVGDNVLAPLRLKPEQVLADRLASHDEALDAQLTAAGLTREMLGVNVLQAPVVHEPRHVGAGDEFAPDRGGPETAILSPAEERAAVSRALNDQIERVGETGLLAPKELDEFSQVLHARAGAFGVQLRPIAF